MNRIKLEVSFNLYVVVNRIKDDHATVESAKEVAGSTIQEALKAADLTLSAGNLELDRPKATDLNIRWKDIQPFEEKEVADAS